MYVHWYIMMHSRDHYCNCKATMSFLFIVVATDLAVYNMFVQFCHRNATMCSLYTIVEQQIFRNAVNNNKNQTVFVCVRVCVCVCVSVFLP